MKCDDCAFADWKRAASGRLHPDKSGHCIRLEMHPLDLRLPAAFYWVNVPSPASGFIERGAELKRPCAFKQGRPAPELREEG